MFQSEICRVQRMKTGPLSSHPCPAVLEGNGSNCDDLKKNQQFGQAGLSMAFKQHPDTFLLLPKGQGNLAERNVTLLKRSHLAVPVMSQTLTTWLCDGARWGGHNVTCGIFLPKIPNLKILKRKSSGTLQQLAQIRNVSTLPRRNILDRRRAKRHDNPLQSLT